MWMSCLRKKSGSIPYFSALDRTQVSAAVMDSCITSPRCPVVVNCFPPRIRLASMNTMSPPTGVHTRPTATPGCFSRKAMNDLLQAVLGEFNLFAKFYAVFGGLLGDQVSVRNVDLLFASVAGQFDD